MLTIDPREPASITDTLRLACSDRSIPFSIGTIALMQFGDYYLLPPGGPMIAVERKTVGDFVSSFLSGRLHVQLEGLRGVCDRPYLLIEGALYYERKAGKLGIIVSNKRIEVSDSTITGVLDGIQCDGVFWQHTDNAEQSVRWLCDAYRRNSAGVQRSVRTVKRPDAKNLRPDVLALCAVPGIGPSLARRLLDEYKTVRGILDSDGVVRGVKGMGDITYKNLLLTFGESDNGKREAVA